MKTTNNLLLNLARCLAQGIPDHDDSVLDVTNIISPVVEVQLPIDAFNVVAASAVHEETWHTSGFHSQHNGAGTDQQLGFCAKGLWRFDVSVSMSSNYQAVALYHFHVKLVDAATGTIYLLGMVPGGAAAAPVANTHSRSLLLLLPKTIEMRAVSIANGVGQFLDASFDVMASRIL